MSVKLALIVLKSSDSATLAAFYRRVGFTMVEERHGNSPIHFSATLTVGVLEIYPSKTSTTSLFGLALEAPDAFRAAWLAAGGTSNASRTLLFDPEGNAVHLS